MYEKKQAVTTLQELQHGQVGKIIDISHKDEDARCRMLSMGIYPGVRVEVLRAAPMGDPLQIRCGSTLISIRKSEAGFIEVAL